MNLDECYKLYNEKKQTLETLKKDVISYAYNRSGKDKYIEPGDFLIKFIPKVDSIISDFNLEKASFLHYINQHIKWMMFSFRQTYTERKEKDDIYKSYYCSDIENTLYLSEEKTEYSISEEAKRVLKMDKNGKLNNSMRKRLEIFTLKNSRSLTDKQIKIIAPLIDRSTDWIYEQKEKLDILCTKRVANRDYLESRHNRLFIEISKDQQRLNIITDSYERDKIIKRIEEKRVIRRRINEKLQNRHCGPRNDEIAKLLNLPKGTIDSSLFYIKKELQNLLPDFKDEEG